MKSVLALAVLLGLAAAAHAESTLDDLKTAERAVYRVWQDMPLTERRVKFITASSEGYGRYTEREGNVFKPGEPVITYVEPVGYAWKQLSEDLFSYGFTVDLALKSEDGTVISEQKNFFRNERETHSLPQEFSMDITLTLSDSPDGKYTIAYTLHDIASDKVSTFEQDFEIKS